MLASQGHGLIIGALLDPEAFAPIAAGFVLFGPVRILSSTIQNVLRPEMSRSLSVGDARSVHRQAVAATASTILVVLALIGVIAVFWEVIFANLYAEQYLDEPMSRIVAFWAITTVMSATHSGSNALLQALRRFAPLALVGALGAVVSMTLVAVAAVFFTAPLTVLGVAAGESTMALGTLWLVVYSRGNLPQDPDKPSGTE